MTAPAAPRPGDRGRDGREPADGWAEEIAIPAGDLTGALQRTLTDLVGRRRGGGDDALTAGGGHHR